ncbi:MAG: wax ester/triacylglycerol synthase family O-acyltransferase [Anaerolineae bacterium]
MNKRKHLEILGPVDTAFYYVDRPETPMNLGALTIFKGRIDFDAFLKTVESRIYRAPVYQQRVIQAPLNLGQPSWVFDPDFHVSRHVFTFDIPKPGGEAQLREVAGQIISGMLDRSKPLWEIYLLNGLEGDRTAILFKVHHCMVDGLSAVELFTMLMDLAPDAPQEERRVVYTPPRLPTSTDLITQAIRADIPHRWGVIKKIGSDAARLGSVLADKEKRRQTFVGIANLLNDNLSRIKPLPINGRNTGRMTLAWAEFSLAEVQAIHSKQHASVNEVMLAILGGGVARYVRDYPTYTESDIMRVIVPVSMRQESEKQDFGNRLSVLPMDIPLNVVSPLERLRKIVEYSHIMKQSSLTIGLDIVLTVPSLYPSFAQPLVWEIAPRAFSLLGHSWCTNVAGPPLPVYVQGHEMQHSYGFFPINPSMGLATVILSYNGRISMTLVADEGIMPDVLHLRDYLKEAFIELRKAAGVPEIPVEGDAPATPPPAEPKPVASTAPVIETPKPAEPPPAAVPETKASETAPAAQLSQPAAAAPTSAIPEPPVNGSTAPTPEPIKAEIPAPPPGEPTNGNKVEATAPETPGEAEPQPVAVPVLVAPSQNGSTALTEPAVQMPAPTTAVAEPPVEQPAPPPASQPDAPAPEPTSYVNGKDETPEPIKLFSEEWAQAYQTAINASADYRKASLHWEAGQLAFVIHASPQHGALKPAAVLLDLHKGDCRAAHNLPVEVAMNRASFVIEGEYENWLKVLNGEADPLKMLMRGALKLRKGSMLRLMPFTQSAQELVRSARHIS